MIQDQPAVLKDLVLIGGGHSHVEVLKNFGMNPIPGVRLTLIARDVNTPYSGMLPGYVAGHYEFDEAHVDLRPLCQFAGARLYHDRTTCIDTESKQVICANRPPVSYNLLSINIGSRPEISSVPGATQFATPVKPINRFVDRWHQMLERVLQQSGPHRIAVVGAGAAGVEILLAIQFRLQEVLGKQQRHSEQLEFHLVSKTEQILPTFSPAVASRFERILKQRNVKVYRGTEASQVEEDKLVLSNGISIELDEILWVTGASAPAWLRESGIEVDDHGFVLANDCLQSSSHDNIFAAGDIVHVINHPRPKAGVFAVRQGKPLVENLRRSILKQPLKAFIPQKTLLALISTGDQYAVASKAFWHLQGKLLWTWKDWIDRRWMAKYAEFPEMPDRQSAPIDAALTDKQTLDEISSMAMRCGGCGAKVGADILSRVINELDPIQRDDILLGLNEPDDAAVIDISPGKVLVQTVDYFRAFVDDPYLFGKIAANHCLSDIFAMGAEAQSAQAIVTLPFGIESKVEESLRQLMAGAIEVLNESKTALVGGHTSEGAELALGFAINGLAERESIQRKSGMQAGDVLILSKALGTGTLLAADMLGKAKGRWIEAAFDSMLLSNRLAADRFFQHQANACTDITGFGLLGHLLEMIRASKVNVEIDLSTIPLIDGALETVRMGILSSLQPANLRVNHVIRDQSKVVNHAMYPLLFDPQTSGGLLASVPAEKADDCLRDLHDAGYVQAAMVGRVSHNIAPLEPINLLQT